MADSEDYLALVTSEYNQKPDYMATLAAFLQAFVDENNLVLEWPLDYDLDTAEGAQLDVVGQWVGLTRQLRVPIAGIYFAFNTAGVGINEGVWLGPGDPAEGVISLDDATYRVMLYIKIAANHWDGTLAQAQQILGQIFADSSGTLFFLVDNFDMSYTQAIAGVLPSALLLGLLEQGYITLKPAAVRVNTIVVSVPGPLFGFNLTNDYIAGFNAGAWGVPL